jgi:hypothetical protein
VIRQLLVATSLAWLAAAGDARADDKAACVAAHEHGQEVRLANHWVEARRLFLACAQPSCPALVVRDCTEWEIDLGQRIPTILVSAKRADGTDVSDVSLTIDGNAVGPKLAVVPIPLDPGEHVLRFEHAGWRPVETRVTLHDGEHDRRVDVQLEPPAASAPVGTRGTGTTGAPVAAYVATGLGVAAAIASGVFLTVGKIDEHDLADSPCGRAGTCTDPQVAPIRTDYIVSGVTAGVAAVAVGIGIWQFLAHGSRSAPASAWAPRIEF